MRIIYVILTAMCAHAIAMPDNQKIVDLVKQTKEQPDVAFGYRYQKQHSNLRFTPCLEGVDLLKDGEPDPDWSLCGIKAHFLVEINGRYYILFMRNTRNVFGLYKVKKMKGEYVWTEGFVRDFELPELYARLEAALESQQK